VYFYSFAIISPWRRAFPSPKDDLWQVWLNWPVVLKKKIFKWPHPFSQFWDYLPFEEDLALNEFPLTKDNLYQVWLNLASWYGEKELKIFSVFFYSFEIISLWRGVIPFAWTNLNPPPPSPKDDFCQTWLRLARWFWRRFLNDPTPFPHFWDYLRFEEELTWTKLNSLHPKIICTSLTEIGLLVLEKKIFKNY
jgi:hypothetical protein